ncbi:MAG: TonB-dependent receptor [Vicinamibacterales bacterium]
MVRGVGKQLVLALWLLAVIPAAAYAQASIVGTVRDSSGAVLPGVTVEAASPALIEKVRSVVTDGAGQYKVVDLRPGSYTITFTLPGFNTARRDGVELTGSFSATVNADMRVGALEETITVTGEAPIVDVQSAAKQAVLNKEVIDAIPSGRNQFNLAVLIPGVSVGASLGGTQDVGGALGDVQQQLVVHGSRPSDQRLTIDGLTMYSAEGSGQFSISTPNMSATQELTIDVGAGSAESPTGGVRMNLIPREGGNRFSGTLFATALNGGFQGNNFNDELRQRGLQTADQIKLITDFAPGAGGPLLRDKLWLFMSYRDTKNHNQVGGIFANKNLNDPTKWTYVADQSNPGIFKLHTWDANARLTWQINTKNKASFYYDNGSYCRCNGVIAGSSPENIGEREYPLNRVIMASWSSPMTSRMLLEAGFSNRAEVWRDVDPRELNSSLRDYLADGTAVHLIGVVEQSSGFAYRSVTKATHTGFTRSLNYQYKAAMSYVTGSHSLKVGFTDNPGGRKFWQSADDMNNLINYRLNNGVPNQLTMYAKPTLNEANIRHDLGIFAQDRWTVRRLTVNAGVRFDYFNDYFPASHAGPGPFVPNRNISFPKTDWVRWKDITPRLGVVYDLSGDGRTAIKVSLSKYMVASGLQGAFGAGSNPVGLLAFAVNRSWADADRDFVPDCDLINPLANGECGAMSDQNFGKVTRSTTIDPETINGWGIRAYNWEFSGGVQRELAPRISAEVSFFRRWYGNFIVTDNRAQAASDFAAFSVVAPTDARLPGGGGYTLNNLYNLNPNRVGQVDQLQTFASNYGKQTESWNGVDASVSARLQNGVLLQGGLSSGRSHTNNCEVLAALPEINPVGLPYCDNTASFLTQYKFLGAYTIPRIGAQASATFQSLPGQMLLANYNASNASVQPSLGRPLSGNAANVTVNLVEPGTIFGDRLNQLDLRLAKPMRLGTTKTTVNLDIYNAFNSSAALVQNNNYASWQQPQRIVNARFFKISAQFDF